MDGNEYKTDLACFWPGAAVWDKPVALVDLAASAVPAEWLLPPCPVIGIGRLDSPAAAAVDVVLEQSATAEALVRGILAAPRAAAATVQLLRILPRLSAEEGLTAESFAYAMLQGSAEHRRWLSANTAYPQASGHLHLLRAGSVLNLLIDRPLAGNAIDRALRDSLYEAFALGALDSSIESVRLRAEGKAFSLGADLSEFGTTTDPATAHAIRTLTLPARMALRCAAKLEVHVQGACVGAGLEIAAFARRVTASASAWFQLPELAMGILPGAGGCVSLTRRIGRQRTAQLILSGKRLSPRQALDWGLVDAIVDDPA